MISFTSAELYAWVSGFLWPLVRILGLMAAAPVFGHASLPARVKIGLGVMIALVIAPAVDSVPAIDPMSFAGLLIVAQQFVVGLAIGFAMRIIFAGVEMAGEIASLSMGLSFASFFDPQSQGLTTVISRFLSYLALLVFLAVDGHLLLIATLVNSFATLPVSAEPLGSEGFRQIANWGGIVFSTGVQLSLPIIAAMLITNLALGILTRAAPQLNIFSVGFPITLAVGFVVLMISLPYLATPLVNLLQDGVEMARQIGPAMAGSK